VLVNLTYRIRILGAEEEIKREKTNDDAVNKHLEMLRKNGFPVKNNENKYRNICSNFLLMDSDDSGDIDRKELIKNLKFFGFTGKNPQVKKEVTQELEKSSKNESTLTLFEFVRFCEKLEKDNYLEKWKHYEEVHDKIEAGSKILNRVWYDAKEKYGKSIDWNCFCEFLLPTLGVDISHKKIWCLKYFFYLSKTDQITEENFNLFNDLFKSLFPSSSKEGSKFLDSLCEFYEQEFFFWIPGKT